MAVSEQKQGTLGIGLQNKAGILYPTPLPPRN